jgi:hypothetical protein
MTTAGDSPGCLVPLSGPDVCGIGRGAGCQAVAQLPLPVTARLLRADRDRSNGAPARKRSILGIMLISRALGGEI